MRPVLSWCVMTVVAAAIVSAGVFLGLRNQTVIQVIAPAAEVKEATGVTAAMASPPDADVQAAVAMAVQRQMAARRDEFLQLCAASTAGDITLEMRLIFDAGGKLISYGVNDPDEKALLPVAKCVREHRPSFAVKGIGRPATVQFMMPLRG